MRLQLQLEHSGKRYRTDLSIRRVLVCFVMASLVFIVSSRSTQITTEHANQVSLVKQGLLAQQSMLEQVIEQSDIEQNALLQHISAMQAKLSLLSLQQIDIAKAMNVKLTDIPIPVPEPEFEPSVSGSLQALQRQLDVQIKQLAILENVFNNTHIDIQQRITGRPIQTGWLSSYYGMRDDPFTGKQAMHKGIDFAGNEGDPVIATAAGVVTWSGERFGYGNLVEINHGNGLVTRYGHNQSLNVVVGEVVTKGHRIATVGNTGRSTGAHVHYEIIKQGKQIDPLPYVYRK
ncbi:MAG: peptidoglycan DD-metalloendopeptidase family protein [Alteromonadaceae bacterium]|nr:peptidoglycan DD-metalloendopeptidase family protein [Alteromonadaceae bacterium]